MRVEATSPIEVCLALARAITRARTMDDIYSAALTSLEDGLGISQAAIALFDPDGSLRIKAARGLPETLHAALERCCPWTFRAPEPAPLVVPSTLCVPSLEPLLAATSAEHVSAIAYIPLVEMEQVAGSLILHDEAAETFAAEALHLASLIAAAVAFAAERIRREEVVRRSEAQLRFALDAACMGTWDWEIGSERVKWSENLERLHGLAPGTFDGTFASYEREIYPDDRARVLASLQRAIQEGTPHDVEYRIVAPDGAVQWVEGKGRVELENGRPVRMTGVCVLVTGRKEAELARLAAAEEANRLKDDFLATLSHELRTPLNAILGWSQMLQGDSLPPERIRPAIDIIGRNARLQAQLIEDILDVSRIIRGRLEIEPRPIIVAPMIDTVLSGLMPSAAAKRITVACEVPDDLPPLVGDPKRLQQVLGNIVSNAIKFTPEGGRVSVRCAVEGERLAIEVSDSGAGITPELLPFIFDRFRQGDSRSTRTHGGLGLGLAIAHHLVERHHGTIRAESGGPGRGTTVHIALPLAKTQGGEDDAVRPPVSSHLRLSDRTVLVIDDQQDSRELMAAFFDQCGASVLQFASAAEGLAAVDSMPVDLVVADIAMPHVDGYEFIERVRKRGDARGAVPAIAVSAYARLEDRSRALASGYNGYCAKPIDALELLRVIDEALAGAS